MRESDAPADAFAAFAHMARLAAALARPFATFDRSAHALGPLSPAEVSALAREPSFARPVERAAAAAAVGTDFAPSRVQALQLGGSAEGRLAILLVSEPVALVEEVALLCAAASMQRQVLSMTGKVERQRIRAALGPVAYQLATQEAPTLYPGLAAFADQDRFRAAMAEVTDEAARRCLIDAGLDLLLRIVAPAAPGIAALVARRLAGGHARAPDNRTPVELRQFVRLFHRRIPAWSATIG